MQGIGLVLRTLRALDLDLFAEPVSSPQGAGTTDLLELVLDSTRDE